VRPGSAGFFVETAANFRSFRRQQTMKTIFALAVVLLLPMRSPAEVQAPILLWPDGAPGALGGTTNDVPTLTPYLPEPTNTTGAAMVICPGGAYGVLAPHE
jgi:hypothetical protein